MWSKRIIITNHAKSRFEERIGMFDKKGREELKNRRRLMSDKKINKEEYKKMEHRSIKSQIRRDLQPRNISKIERFEDEPTKRRVTTRHNKVYIVLNESDRVIVKTTFEECSCEYQGFVGARARKRNQVLSYLEPVVSKEKI